VGLDGNIRKSILLSTSGLSRTLSPPFFISLREAEMVPEEGSFNRSGLPVAVLLEGVFPSAFRNRPTENLVNEPGIRVREESVPTKMIVVADGDIIRNEVRRSGTVETPLPLGQDRYTLEMFGNRDFILNCLNYLVDDHGIMELRSRELKLRLLDGNEVKNRRMFWQTVNIAGPVVLVLVAGFLFGWRRRIKYSKSL